VELTLFGGRASAQYLDDLWRLRWDGSSYDACATAPELDGDDLAGCADPDCYGSCDPLCPPSTSCPAERPGCGDGTCDPLETRELCATDCGQPRWCARDHACSAGETMASCPGDCS
jgi:hypothetical protein